MKYIIICSQLSWISRNRPSRFDLYALSIFLLLCGDIESNPGPTQCKICNEEVSDEPKMSIRCSMCEDWIHKSCTGLAETDFRVMIKPTITWLCVICNVNITAKNYFSNIGDNMAKIGVSLLHIDTNLKTQTALLEKHSVRLDVIEINQTDILKRIERLENLDSASSLGQIGVSLASPSLVAIKTDQVLHIKDCIKELDEEKKRPFNLIIFNLKEGKKDSSFENKEEDLKQIHELVDFLGADINREEIKGFRLGKKIVSYTRPYKITFASVRDKWTIINLFWEMKRKGKVFNGIGMSLDRSKDDRLKYKLLREELSKRKLNGENVVIKKGQIVESDVLNPKDLLIPVPLPLEKGTANDSVNVNRISGVFVGDHRDKVVNGDRNECSMASEIVSERKDSMVSVAHEFAKTDLKSEFRIGGGDIIVSSGIVEAEIQGVNLDILSGRGSLEGIDKLDGLLKAGSSI